MTHPAPPDAEPVAPQAVAADAATRAAASAATPMLRQYLEVKARHPDALLFFRLGDFYELFFEDAVKASEALQITLTARAKGDEKVPMCGVPHHAARGHVARLLERGFKVAICDQVEEPGKSALVRREVTRVVTPGMVLDDEVLDPREPSYVGAVALAEHAGGGFALLDASTGELSVGEAASDGQLADELRRAGVRELLAARDALREPRGEALARAVGAPVAEREGADFERAGERLCRRFEVASLDGFGVGDLPLGLAAAAAALAYLEETQHAAAAHVDRMHRVAGEGALHLDEATRANLELERTLQGGKRKGSLLWLLDRSVTGLGARRLAAWLRWPLREVSAIEARLDAVAWLTGSAMAREAVVEALRPVADLERLLSRLTLRQGNARDLRALAGSLLALPRLAALLTGGGEAERAPALLREAAAGLGGQEELAALLDRGVAEEPPAGLAEGGLIRRGFSAELDAVRGAGGGRPRRPGKARGRAARRHLHRLAEGPLQPRVRVLPGGHQGEPAPRPARLGAAADHGGRGALRHPGAEGVRGAGARRRRAARRPGGRALRAAAGRGGGGERGAPRRGLGGGHPRRAGGARAGGGRARLREAGGGPLRGAGDRGGAPPGGGGDAPARLGRLRPERPSRGLLSPARRGAGGAWSRRREGGRRAGPAPRHHRAQHGGEEHGAAPGRAHRPARADGLLRARPARQGRAGGPHLHPSGRLGRPGAGRAPPSWWR